MPKIYECEICKYKTHIKRLMTHHKLLRKNKCSVNSNGVSITHIVRKDKTHNHLLEKNHFLEKSEQKKDEDDYDIFTKKLESDMEEDDDDLISTDTNNYMADILTEMSRLTQDDITLILKLIIKEHLDDEEKNEFLEDLINE